MNIDSKQLHEHMSVYSKDGERLGKVFAIRPDHFLIQKGVIFPKDYVVATSEVESIQDDRIILRETKDHLMSRAAGASRTSAERGQTLREGQTERIPLVEEELEVSKHAGEQGSATVRKEVHTEMKSVEVPVRREELVVERSPAPSGAAVPPDAFKEQEISVPLRDEEVEVHKRAKVREEVQLKKNVHHEEQRVAQPVRKEDLEVDTEGEVHREGEAPRGAPPPDAPRRR